MASPSQVQVIRQNLMASQVQVQARDLDLELTWTWTWICDLYPALNRVFLIQYDHMTTLLLNLTTENIVL